MDNYKFVRLIQFKVLEFINRIRIKYISYRVANQATPKNDDRPIVFFNASARMHYLSQNAAFSLIASWGLSLAEKNIIHFVCQSGMKNCVLGTNILDINQPPPCQACQEQSNRLFQFANVHNFSYSENAGLSEQLKSTSLVDLMSFTFEGLPLGEIILPSIRWRLRRHNLIENQTTIELYKSYILSAYNIAENFQSFLDKNTPSHLVLFNGQMYPEAIAKTIAKKNGVDVITHEVGLEPLTGYFTRGEATAYPLPIPDDYQLTSSENKKLDTYLSNRFQGNFTMAGVKFWDGIQSLDSELIAEIKRYKHLVPIFTNVIFDTSQKYANTIFADMFEWLKSLIPIIQNNPHTLFVLRAHPDESRPGKAAVESVAEFVKENKLLSLDNLIFIDSHQNLSSYELILKSKFILVYNSSIGLEGTLLGKPVLSAGKARYTQYPIVSYPENSIEYKRILDQWLIDQEIEIPSNFLANARKFLFFQLYKSSLPFSKYIETHKLPGYVFFRNFEISQLNNKNLDTIPTILKGIEEQGSFLID
jgi:hypothetical protein